jgi:hypothetical protein
MYSNASLLNLRHIRINPLTLILETYKNTNRLYVVWLLQNRTNSVLSLVCLPDGG